MKALRLWLSNRKRLHSKPHCSLLQQANFWFPFCEIFLRAVAPGNVRGRRWCQRGDTRLLRWLAASPTERPQKPRPHNWHQPLEMCRLTCTAHIAACHQNGSCTFCDVSHIEPGGVWDEHNLKGGARIANSCCHTQPSSWNSRPRAGLRARALRQICSYLELSKKGNENDTSLIRCHLLTVTDDDHGQPPLARGWCQRLTFVSGASSSSPADVWSLCSPWASDIE